MDPDTLHAATRRFPLVGWPRPTCPSLPERIDEIATIADTARKQGADGMAEAAHALNKAALVASDCGLTEHARDLCWQHINIYRANPQLTVLQARYMLEPVINLARLQIRADAGEQALRLLHTVYQAVLTRTDPIIDGHTLPLVHLAGTAEEHRNLRDWVWLQYLTEGIRALTLAGRWDDALTHAETHRGIARHLMEGRQVAIITRCLHGAWPAARALLQESQLTHPWEQDVGACLNIICTDPAVRAAKTTTMINRFLSQRPKPGYAVFRARLGLTITTLTGNTDPTAANHVLARTANEAINAPDGYAAREILTYRSDVTTLTEAHRKALTELVAACGLGAKSLPPALTESLTTTTQTAADALARATSRPS
ncbi:hypothetical protein [Plantactinospora sp. CA-290183]|uniref:hypothetical protein n=1 Tax=Plantactinospora sp. CA-290183 TaxID=3240006 RepID=UPI003D8EE458